MEVIEIRDVDTLFSILPKVKALNFYGKPVGYENEYVVTYTRDGTPYIRFRTFGLSGSNYTFDAVLITQDKSFKVLFRSDGMLYINPPKKEKIMINKH